MQTFCLDDLRLLGQLAQSATFLEVGKRLGVATTTVSRRIAALEASTGTQLVNRTHVGSPLTAAGMHLVQTTQALISELEAQARGIAGLDQQISGTLKISVVEGLVPLTLTIIQSFREHHPGVSFTLDASNRAVDMSISEADIALRTIRPLSDGLIVRSVLPIHFGVYTSSRKGVRRNATSMATFLARSDAVILGGEQRGLKENLWLKERTRSIAMEVGSLSALMEAVRLGMGVGVIPDELVQVDSALSRVGNCEGVPRKTLWMVMNRQTSRVARVRRFGEYLLEHLRAKATG